MNYAANTITVETPLGPVEVVATEGKHIHVSCKRNQPLTVNRVDWRVSFHMIDYGNGFEMAKEKDGKTPQQWFLDRADFKNSSWESDRKAKAKVEAAVCPTVIEALRNQPSFLRRAELSRLNEAERNLEKQIEELEKEIVEKRRQIEQTRNVLAQTRDALRAADATEREVVTVLE